MYDCMHVNTHLTFVTFLRGQLRYLMSSNMCLWLSCNWDGRLLLVMRAAVVAHGRRSVGDRGTRPSTFQRGGTA